MKTLEMIFLVLGAAILILVLSFLIIAFILLFETLTAQDMSNVEKYIQRTDGKFEVTVWVFKSGDRFEIMKLLLSSSDSVGYVKGLVEKSQNLPVHLQVMSNLGEILRDERTLLDYNIHSGSTISVIEH